VFLDARIRRIDEHGFQIGDVPIDAVRDVTVRPVNGDVLGVTLLQAIPLLVGEHIELERVELGNMRLGDRFSRFVPC
jgi:hypothetical protein